ncbi:MAG: DUF3108 domain-containing protein [Gammaproteobacteria bacterium]|nr:DUF3108 domain-containing protein [Gammaproteobacteria bacterium]
MASQTVAAVEPVSYSAVYKATSRGLSATAHRSLERRDDQQYVLENTLNVTVAGARLGRIKEISIFTWTNNRLQPVAYRYSQSGISRKRERIQFDWKNNSATSTEDDESWTLKLTPNVIDKLGYQLLLRQELQHTDNTQLEFQIIDTHEIETHRFRVAGRELLETPLGKLNTVKIERVADGDSKRSTAFWLAADWNMLLVRLVQTSRSGAVTELMLEQAVVGNRELTALP